MERLLLKRKNLFSDISNAQNTQSIVHILMFFNENMNGRVITNCFYIQQNIFYEKKIFLSLQLLKSVQDTLCYEDFNLLKVFLKDNCSDL